MKKNGMILFVSLLTLTTAISCQSNPKKKSTESPEPKTMVVSENIRFCESTYPYNGGILIANFGTEQLNPLNNEGKGYINFFNEGKMNTLIAADGNLSAPKGMYIKDDYLFICDVNKIVVYNLKTPAVAPQTITFPKDDLFVNDLAADGNTLYATVTNSGRIYRIDITHPSEMSGVTPVKWIDIAGPNGLIIDGGIMYIASYPADGNTTDANVIYQIRNLATPVVDKFINVPGQYDGIALSADKQTMYITNWSPAGISTVDMLTKQLSPLTIDEKLVGPADITVVDSMMYIPDLPNSRMIIKTNVANTN